MPYQKNPFLLIGFAHDSFYYHAIIFVCVLTAALLAYTFVIYPLLIILIARASKFNIKKNREYLPKISILLVVKNEESRIQEKIVNILGSDYPTKPYEIIVVSDGSTDLTASKANSLGQPNLKLLERPVSSGKAACINEALQQAQGEIIIFTDARQVFEPQTISELIANFADHSVGAVSGELEIASAQHLTTAGLGLYWHLEKLIRHAEGRFDSTIGCTGAVYAMRRACLRPIPGDTILDDVVFPMQAALAGSRVIFEPLAQAFDPQPQTPAVESLRKERTIAGNFQMLFRYPSWLLPWKNRLAWQLVSHKYLRLASPLLLFLLFGANIALLATPFFAALFALQLIFYTMAIAGSLFPRVRLPLLAGPAAFLFLNVMTVKGFWRYIKGYYKTGWTTST